MTVVGLSAKDDLSSVMQGLCQQENDKTPSEQFQFSNTIIDGWK